MLLCAALLLPIDAGAASSPADDDKPPSVCSPADGLSFICGTGAVEELAAVPGTRWLIAGALNVGAPAVLHLIDRVAKKAQPVEVRFDPEPATMRGCPGVPDPGRWSIDGLAVAAVAGGIRLYAANHGDRRAIEIFAISRSTSPPLVRWIGCAAMPAHTLPNAITATPDGFLVTSFHDPDDAASWQRLARGEPVSSVWSWRVGNGFTRVQTGPLAGGNGIARAHDGRHLYVSAWAERALLVLDTKTGRRRKVPLDFLPDNLHVDDDGSLLIAGQRTTVAAIAHCAEQCRQPWVVARYHPADGQIDEVVAGDGTTAVNYACGAQVIGDDLWITVRGDDRIAWLSARRTRQ